MISTLPVSFDPYIRLGWHLVPIPHGTKGPIHSGWNLKQNTVTDPNQIPSGYGVGLAHAYSGTMSLDIDDHGAATSMLAAIGIDLNALLNAPDAVQIISGNAGHGKLIYAMPLGMALPSKKLTYQQLDGQTKTAYELRCATSTGTTVQDVLPPSIHPMTLRPYQWGGRGNWERLPLIPDALLNHWQDLLSRDHDRTISTTTIDASWDEIKSALYAIPANIGRDDWVTLGMALHYAGSSSGQLDQACALWDEWSSTGGDKYRGPNDIMTCWRSFKADPSGIKLGSLFKLAYDRGWSRPQPDVASLFAPIKPNDPNAILDLLTLRIQPPVADATLFPPLLAEYAEQVGLTRGCDPMIPLWAGIAACCGAIDARTRLEVIPGFRVPPVLWIMTIGDPSDRKSPGTKPMFDPLIAIEHEDRDRYKSAHLMWTAQEAAVASETKALHDWAKSADSSLKNTVTPKVRDLPPEPMPLRLTVSDSTSQKVIHISAGNPQGMVMHLDEMANWIKRINDPKSGDDRGCWIAGYESRPYTMDRVTAGTIHSDMFSLAIYGNIQPDIFRREVRQMSGDGLLQRFIPVVLRGDKTTKPKSIAGFLTREADYDLMLRKLRTIQPTTYHLSEEAFRAYDQFQDWYLSLRTDERTVSAHPIYLTALGKIEGTCARLALILHMIESPYNAEISGDLMRRTCTIVRSYVVPALRHTFGEAAMEDMSIDRWMVEHMVQLAGEQEQVSLAQIKHSSRKQPWAKVAPWQLDQEILTSMDYLQRSNWVRLVAEDGRRNSYTWAINPTIATTYSDYRRRVIDAKQRIKDSILAVCAPHLAADDPRRRVRGA